MEVPPLSMNAGSIAVMFDKQDAMYDNASNDAGNDLTGSPRFKPLSIRRHDFANRRQMPGSA